MNKKFLQSYWDEFLQAYYLQECPGCPKGHSSFWRTIIKSQEWQAWKKYAEPKLLYDFSEVEELGILGQKHFQDFLKFTIKESKKI